MLIPLHLKHDDDSVPASLKRLHLYQTMYALTKGRGFRQPPGISPKRIKPRRGHKTRFNRIESLVLHAKYAP